MRILKILFWSLVILLVGINLFILLSGRTYLYKGLANTYFVGRSGPDIAEKEIFPNRRIDPSVDPMSWPAHSRKGELELEDEDRSYMDSMRTASFLVFHRDSLLFEHYGEGFHQDSVSNSFSVAKSIVNVLTGIALRKGLIDSLDERVGEYLPSFDEGKKEQIRLRDLLSMRSGLNWEESGGNPFSHNAQAYYGNDLQGLIEGLKVVGEPGRSFDYQSGNTLIMGAVLHKATGQRLARFAEKELWEPLGASNAAFWNLDRRDGMEKAFCCFYSVPRDLARIGKLYMQRGEWQGEQLVPARFVERSISPSGRKGKKTPFYGYFWWLEEYDGKEIFYARGILGQYIIVVPEEDLIIVRTGRIREDRKEGSVHPGDLDRYLEVGVEFQRSL